MTGKELKKLSRAELLELLLQQSREMERLQRKLDRAEKQLQSRQIMLEEAGNIAEAALRINEVFEAAQQAADQYLENVKRLSEQRTDRTES